MWDIYASIVVAIIALVGTIYTANITRGKLDKSEAVKLEARLKDIEADQKLMQKGIDIIEKRMITEEEKKCLLLVNERVNTILRGLGTFVPKDLKNPTTLRNTLETLSNKAETGGWNAVIDYVKNDLDSDKREDLLDYLEDVSSDESLTQKRFWATLYLGLLRLELDKDEVLCLPAQ